MKRTAGAWILLATLGGCMSPDHGQDPAAAGFTGCYGGGGVPRTVPGVQGPWGQPVNMASPYASASAQPSGEQAARAMIAQSVPLDLVQAANAGRGMGPSGVMQAGGYAMPDAPSGVVRAGGNVTPGGAMPNMIMPTAAISPLGVPFTPGGSPLPPTAGPCGLGPAGAVAAVGALTGPPGPVGPPPPGPFPSRRTEVRFAGPAGMKISWYAGCPGTSCGSFSSSNQLEAPGRYNFTQAAIYRLKLTDIPNRPGLELYPTLEVVPSNPKTDVFLAHSAVPVQFTEEDFEQVACGNFVVKVIYLPDPQFQDLAATCPDEVVSTRLEPGVDPICEAHRRGCILLIVRIGNIDLEAPNTPAMDAPNMYMNPPACPPGGPVAMGPGGPMMMPPNGPMVPAGGPLAAPPPGMFRGPAGAGAPGFGPNTPMIMGPNGPVPVGANGQPMGNPGMPASFMLPPVNPAAQSGTAALPMTKSAGQTSMQQTNYPGAMPTSIAAASTTELPGGAPAQPAPPDASKTPSDGKPPQRRTLFNLFSSDK